jgi:putative polyhydroxyalkanoate system protein
MSEIRIHRDHSLGLTEARKLAVSWADKAKRKFDLNCTVTQGEAGDTVSFSRNGVNGRLLVTADHFDLHAKLGLMMGAFAKAIESEIRQNLDELLSQRGARRRA